MRSILIPSYIIFLLAFQGNCTPAVDTVARNSVPTAHDGTTVAVPLIANAAGVSKAFEVAKPGTKVPPSAAISVESRDAVLRKRSNYFCTGTPVPNSADCDQVINTAYNDNESISLPANLCFTINYKTCAGYVCSTPCGGYDFGTNWFGDQLSDLMSLCVDIGQTGEIYTDSDVIYEVGLVYNGQAFPQYEAC